MKFILLKNLKRHFQLILDNLFLDKNEKIFIKFNKKNYKKKKIKKQKYILIQIVSDYYFLSYYKTLFLEKRFDDYKIIGLWPYYQRTVRKRGLIIEVLNELYLFFLDYIIFLKWKKLYNSIGISDFERLNLSLTDRFFFLLN